MITTTLLVKTHIILFCIVLILGYTIHQLDTDDGCRGHRSQLNRLSDHPDLDTRDQS